MNPRFCIGPDCSRVAQEGDFCWAHTRQRRRGKPLAKVRHYDSARDRVQALIAAYYAALDGPEDGVKRAWGALKQGMRAYIHAVKPTDPRGGGGRG